MTLHSVTMERDDYLRRLKSLEVISKKQAKELKATRLTNVALLRDQVRDDGIMAELRVKCNDLAKRNVGLQSTALARKTKLDEIQRLDPHQGHCGICGPKLTRVTTERDEALARVTELEAADVQHLQTRQFFKDGVAAGNARIAELEEALREVTRLFSDDVIYMGCPLDQRIRALLGEGE